MIVITGPNGNVGLELVRSMQGRNVPWRVAAHNVEKTLAQFGPDLPAVRFDYGDRSTWPAVLEGIDTLFLLFPLPHPRTARAWMVPFVEAAAAAGCRHIVYVSVPGADRLSFVPHHTVEQAISESGVGFTILRAAYFFQNLTRELSTHYIDIRDHDEIFIPAKNAKTTFIDSRDVAELAATILTDPAPHRNESYLLSGPEAIDFYRVAEVMTEELGRPIRYTNPSFPRFWARMFRRGVAWDVVSFMTIVYMLTRFGKNRPVTDTLPRLLGRPATDVRGFVHAYKERWERDG